ncbi:hypothetical protein MLC59_12485 [Marinobacter bryozoorum]|uniref:hypothetical protein n=1 Tax=Marinobacter bryozoorum TaxID=256324 RepID=UPI0020048C7B|nr:hypothetical protein [Marinobacter bryozoorum]MCK7544978.1 hypothetical protein [Marinobacter bryozoorum]
MPEDANVTDLQKAIAELLTLREATDFRWASEEERGPDDHYVACLIIDGEALFYFWDLEGSEEMDRISGQYGYFIEPRNRMDICFYSLAKWRSLPFCVKN